ncbi:MAG: hypothetical protein HY815_12055 [Candidatus Riflebacteria bacterium]|nr:hypothetical protein [Candidatus Riflebacteria bacterium]
MKIAVLTAIVALGLTTMASSLRAAGPSMSVSRTYLVETFDPDNPELQALPCAGESTSRAATAQASRNTASLAYAPAPMVICVAGRAIQEEIRGRPASQTANLSGGSGTDGAGAVHRGVTGPRLGRGGIVVGPPDAPSWW